MAAERAGDALPLHERGGARRAAGECHLDAPHYIPAVNIHTEYDKECVLVNLDNNPGPEYPTPHGDRSCKRLLRNSLA